MDIRQVFTIDASAALANLTNLNKGLQQFQQSLTGVTQAQTAFNSAARGQGLARMAANISAVQQGLNGIGNNPGLNQLGTQIGAVTRATGVANRGVGDLTISWQTFIRVVQTQAIVRALSVFRNVLKASVGDAIELQKQIALIQTIGDGAGVRQIGDAVRQISDDFNIPLLETASGLYNTLSNNVGTFAESVQFASEAAVFARTTNSSLSDSVDLLSGVLRAYNLDVDETARISSILFTAIDKGRITADELANSLGRVSEPASQLGVDIEEVAIGVAAITDRGIGASEALTQFRGILNALTKPTVALRNTFRELGFESAEQAIQTRGLSNLLQDLADSTDGTTQALAKMFPNIRGIGGQLSLTNENLEDFAKNLALARDRSNDFIDARFAEVLATDAQTVTDAFNRIRNALTEGFGQDVLAIGTAFVEASGGAKQLAARVESLSEVLIPLGAVLGSVGVAAIAARASVLLLGTTLGPVGLAIGATATALALFRSRFDELDIKKTVGELDELGAQFEATNKQITKTSQAAFEAQKAANDAIVQNASNVAVELNKEFLASTTQIEETSKTLTKSIESLVTNLVRARERTIDQLRASAKDSEKQIESSLDRISSLTNRLNQISFDQGVSGFDDTTESFKRIERGAQLAREAANALREAAASGDSNLQDQAREQFKIAEQELRRAEGLAEGADNIGLQRKAVDELQTLLRRQRDAEQAVVDKRRESLGLVNQQVSRNQTLIRQTIDLGKIADANRAGRTDAGGNALSQAEIDQRTANRRGALRGLRSLGLGEQDFRNAAQVGIRSAVEVIGESLAQPFELTLASEAAVANLEAQIQGVLTRVQQVSFLPDLQAVTPTQIQTPSDILNALRATTAETEKQRQSAEQLDRLQRERNVALNQATALVARFNSEQERAVRSQTDITLRGSIDELGAIVSQFAGGSGARAESLNGLGEAFSLILQDAKVTNEELSALKPILEGLQGVNFSVFGSNVAGDVEVARRAVGQLIRIRDLTKEIDAEPTGSRQRADILQNVLNTVDQKLQSNLEVSRRIADEAVREANARVRGANALNATPGTGAQFGGFFASGGVARGVDTQTVSVSPGESIINARSTAKFFSQLQGINAGVAPVNRESTSNTFVGDINVPVTTTQVVDGRLLGQQINREIRKRSLRR